MTADDDAQRETRDDVKRIRAAWEAATYRRTDLTDLEGDR